MTSKTRIWIGVVAGGLILAAGGFGIAVAGSGGDGDQISGSTAQLARAAAAQAVPGGIAGQVRSESDGGYGVQVSKPDGTTSAVHLDKTFKPLTVGPAVNGGDGDGPDGDEG
ncbi:MAG TPA: hypothetical protein VFN75_10540 [Pseudonocardiaceae bacterium]|nr:hypothetical protein [Pseudonocardiaceae bacterium]